MFLRLAQVDDALVFGGQWLRPWTACLVDYGLAQFLVMEPGERQKLLEQDGPLARAEALLSLMGGEVAE